MPKWAPMYLAYAAYGETLAVGKWRFDDNVKAWPALSVEIRQLTSNHAVLIHACSVTLIPTTRLSNIWPTIETDNTLVADRVRHHMAGRDQYRVLSVQEGPNPTLRANIRMNGPVPGPNVVTDTTSKGDVKRREVADWKEVWVIIEFQIDLSEDAKLIVMNPRWEGESDKEKDEPGWASLPPPPSGRRSSVMLYPDWDESEEEAPEDG